MEEVVDEDVRAAAAKPKLPHDHPSLLVSVNDTDTNKAEAGSSKGTAKRKTKHRPKAKTKTPSNKYRVSMEEVEDEDIARARAMPKVPKGESSILIPSDDEMSEDETIPVPDMDDEDDVKPRRFAYMRYADREHASYSKIDRRKRKDRDRNPTPNLNYQDTVAQHSSKGV